MTEIDNDDHPVEVGLADAFYIDEVVSDSDGSRKLIGYVTLELNVWLVGAIQ